MDDGQPIRDLINGLLRKKGDSRGFTDADSLFASGRLASVDALEVMLLLEQSYGIDFSDGFNRDELDSVNDIKALIAAK